MQQPCSDSTNGFVLYKAVGPGTFAFLSKVAVGETYRDRHVYRGLTYRYQARSKNNAGVEGPASSVVSMTVVDEIAPAPPTNLQVTTWSGSMRLTWDAPADNSELKGYNFYVSTSSGGPYTRVNSTLITIPTRTFTAQGLSNGTVYYAVVRSVDFAGNEGANSQEVSAVPGP